MKSLVLLLVPFLFLQGCGDDTPEDATSTPTRKEELLQNCIEAAGGADVLMGLQVIHTADSIFMAGMTGTTESWWQREPFMGLSVTNLGPVSQTVLMVGDSVWTVDRNGHLAPGGAEARDQMLLSKYTVFYDYLFDTSMVRFGADTIIDDRPVVPMHLDFQQDIVFYVSTDTWLPEIMTATTMGLELRSYPMDYEEIGGIMSPRTNLSTIPAFGQEIRSINLLTEYNMSIPDSIFTLGATEGDWTLEDPGSPMPFSIEGDHIYLTGEVNGREVTILLDSGAGATVIDSALASDLGLETSGSLPARGIGGTQDFSFVEVAEYRAAGAVVRDQVIAMMPLADQFYPLTGMRIQLILGYDFLSRFVTRIDYGGELITLFDPQDYQVPETGACVIPASRSMSLLSIPAVLEDSIDVNLLLDTGAGGSIHLTPSFFQQHPGFLEGRPLFETSVSGVGGEESISGFRVSSVTVGNFTVPGGLCSSFQGGDVFDQYDGIIGSGILSRFVLTLDYSSGRIILQPSSLFDEGLPESLTGMGLEISGDRIAVGSVIPGSPAEEAGLEEGDILLSIDGEPVDESEFRAVSDRFPQEEGSAVSLVIDRDGREMTLELITCRLVPLQE